jgi:hypothetical protein
MTTVSPFSRISAGVFGAGQGQGHDAALEPGGRPVGVDPEGKDNGAREGTVRPFLPLHDGTVIDRLWRSVAAHGDGVALDRDVELLGRNAGDFRCDDGAIGTRPEIERREFGCGIETQASEQPVQVGLRPLHLAEGIETPVGGRHPFGHHLVEHVFSPLSETTEFASKNALFGRRHR